MFISRQDFEVPKYLTREYGFFPDSVTQSGIAWLFPAKEDESQNRAHTQITHFYPSTDIKYFREKNALGLKVCVSFQLEMELQSRGLNPQGGNQAPEKPLIIVA